MIPFLTSTYIRLGLAVGLVLIVAAMGWRVSVWKQAHEALPGVREALAAEVACTDGSKCAERVAALTARQEQESARVIEGLTSEIRDISNRPARTVRLRCTASDGDMSRASASGSTNGSPPAGGQLSTEAGQPVDVDALYRLARDADEQVALRRALIEWNKALSTVE